VVDKIHIDEVDEHTEQQIVNQISPFTSDFNILLTNITQSIS
jgi:hypothetical protein